MSPREIDRMTPGEFEATTRGYLRSRGVDVDVDAGGDEAEYFAALVAFEKAGRA